MSLTEIFESPLFYEKDLTIEFNYGKDAKNFKGFELGILTETHWTYPEEYQGLNTFGINGFLVKQGYRPVNRRTVEMSFDPSWDYRLRAPEWEVFWLWLIVYYTDQHNKQEQQIEKYANDPSHVIRDFYKTALAREKAYAGILTQLQQETLPDCNTLWQWTAEQIDASHENRITGYTYKHICDVFRDYQDLMERVHHAQKWEEHA